MYQSPPIIDAIRSVAREETRLHIINLMIEAKASMSIADSEGISAYSHQVFFLC